MKKFFKVLGIVVLVIFILGFIGSLLDTNDSAATKTVGDQNTEVKATTSDESEVAPTPKKKPDVEILSMNDKADSFMSSVFIEVRNNTNKTAGYADFKSYYLNEKGAIIAAGIGNLSDFGPGQTKTVQIITTDNISEATQYRVEVNNVMWQ